MNHFVGIGRLVRDPNVKYTQGGKAVARFTLAIDDGWGEKKKTYFIPVTCWEKLAEACGNNLVKGRRSQSWERSRSAPMSRTGRRRTLSRWLRVRWILAQSRVEQRQVQRAGERSRGHPYPMRTFRFEGE